MTGALMPPQGYDGIQTGIVELLESARLAAARTVNALMTATYWEIGRRIVEYEQAEQDRAGHGQPLMKRLPADLSRRFGRGFGVVNLHQMRLFYLAWPPSAIGEIYQAPSDKSAADPILQTASEESSKRTIVPTPSGEFFELPRLAKANAS